MQICNGVVIEQTASNFIVRPLSQITSNTIPVDRILASNCFTRRYLTDFILEKGEQSVIKLREILYDLKSIQGFLKPNFSNISKVCYRVDCDQQENSIIYHPNKLQSDLLGQLVGVPIKTNRLTALRPEIPFGLVQLKYDHFEHDAVHVASDYESGIVQFPDSNMKNSYHEYEKSYDSNAEPYALAKEIITEFKSSSSASTQSQFAVLLNGVVYYSTISIDILAKLGLECSITAESKSTIEHCNQSIYKPLI
ncbi:TPA: hypothetical protein ACX6RO_001900 [Photobacterium damselae]